MRFAQADAAIDKQRVVAGARIVRDLQRGRAARSLALPGTKESKLNKGFRRLSSSGEVFHSWHVVPDFFGLITSWGKTLVFSGAGRDWSCSFEESVFGAGFGFIAAEHAFRKQQLDGGGGCSKKSRASCSISCRNFSRTHCATKRFGALDQNLLGLIHLDGSGLIQVLSCWAFNVRAKWAMQWLQNSCMSSVAARQVGEGGDSITAPERAGNV
jgi:hypothetical protein